MGIMRYGECDSLFFIKYLSRGMLMQIDAFHLSVWSKCCNGPPISVAGFLNFFKNSNMSVLVSNLLAPSIHRTKNIKLQQKNI